jgi:hypothetical protein
MAKKFEMPSFDSARVKAAFADVKERAEAARGQVASRRADFAEFNKGNVEALKAAGKIVVDGAKPLANEAVANTKKQLDAVVANVKGVKGKKPAELVKGQGEFAKAQFAVVRDETKQFGQSVAKLAGDAVEPLKSRFASVRADLKAA